MGNTNNRSTCPRVGVFFLLFSFFAFGCGSGSDDRTFGPNGDGMASGGNDSTSLDPEPELATKTFFLEKMGIFGNLQLIRNRLVLEIL